MEEILVSAENLKYMYKNTDRFAIDHHTFTIMKGEVIGLVGPNGAGKTTLCLGMKGIIPHKMGGKWGGSIRVCDLDVSKSSISIISQKVAMTFQDPETQIVGTTVDEDLAFLPENLGADPLEIKNGIDRFMKIVRLPSSYKKRAPFNMSGGEKQRLAIASSLIAKPAITILDEPTTELDPVGKKEVIEVVEEVVKEGDTTFVIVEQDLDHLISITDRLFVIIDGKIKIQGKTRDVLKNMDFLEENQVIVPDVVKLWKNTPLINYYPIFINVDEAVTAINEQISLGSLSFVNENLTIKDNKNKNNIITFENVSFSYQEHEVLKDINLKIKEGDFCAILGKNGAGKTTLVKHINGLLKPSKGILLINGINTKDKTVAEMAKKVSYVFQNPDHQLFAKTVEEEIAFGPKNLGWDDIRIKKQVEFAIKACSLDKYRHENPLSLERGLKQLLILASVISMDVDIFIVDEPTTGLSNNYKIIIGNILNELNKLGKTIILVTHDMPFVAKYAKNAIVIRDGKAAIEGDVRTVFSHTDELASSFVYPPQITLVANQISHQFNEIPISIEEFINRMEWRRKNE